MQAAMTALRAAHDAVAALSVDALTAACQDPEIPRWTLVPVPYRRADALSWIAATELELNAGLAIDWLVVDADDTLLASIALMGIDREQGTGDGKTCEIHFDATHRVEVPGSLSEVLEKLRAAK